MSIAGEYGDARDSPRLWVDRGLHALSTRSRSASHLWANESIALGYNDDSGFATRAGSALVFDGWLANRNDLARMLDIVERGASNAGLALAAYERWGDEFLNYLVGDFACALWDKTRHRLGLGRDPLGHRPLYFAWLPGRVIFANEPRGLLCHPEIPKEIDEIHLGRWMVNLPETDTSSFFRRIERVLPGHLLLIEGDQHRFHRYWRPENIPMLRLRRPEDYADALKATLTEAVAGAIPETGKVGSSLSGGLDSGSVTALAAGILADQNRRLTSFTIVPSAAFDAAEHPGKLADESPLAALLVARHHNIDHVLVPIANTDILAKSELRELAADRPIASIFFGTVSGPLEYAARNHGIDVLLTGSLGNRTISYDGHAFLSSLLRQGRLVTLLRELRLARANGYKWRALLNASLAPLLSLPIRRRIALARGRFIGLPRNFSALSPDFAEANGFWEEAEDAALRLQFSDHRDSRAQRLSMLTRRDWGLDMAAQRRLHGIDHRSPALDRRVIELCLSIPEDQYWRNGESRSLIRRAMTGILPPETLAERRRGRPAAEVPRMLLAGRDVLAAELARAEDSPVAGRLLDFSALRQLHDDWPQAESAWKHSATILPYLTKYQSAVAVVRFIRRIEGGNA